MAYDFDEYKTLRDRFEAAVADFAIAPADYAPLSDAREALDNWVESLLDLLILTLPSDHPAEDSLNG